MEIEHSNLNSIDATYTITQTDEDTAKRVAEDEFREEFDIEPRQFDVYTKKLAMEVYEVRVVK